MKMKPVLALALIGGLGACLAKPEPKVPTGAEDFASYCAACHGSGGKGDGEVSETLGKKPADLTTLAARNDGVFPSAQVMTKIWGYAKEDGRVMPAFAPLLETDLVLFDSGDGIATPTPLRLVQLGEYVKSLQQ